MEPNQHQFETEAIRFQMERGPFMEHSSPVYLTSSFVFEDAEDMRAAFAEEKQRTLYSRYGNPNTWEFVGKVCRMEGAEAGFGFASGMSAVFSTFAALLGSGDRILSCRTVFGSTFTLFDQVFPRWGIHTDYFLPDQLADLPAQIRPGTRCIYVETPTNPGVEVLDLSLLGQIARDHGLLLIVDNCFATPYLQRPLEWGAQLVIHSGTKLMDGQGRVLAGVTVGDAPTIDRIYRFARVSGPALSPFNAWILSKSLETLAVRLDRHCASALEIARRLEGHPAVDWVRYPFLPSHPSHALAVKQMKAGGSIVSFQLTGGLGAGRRFFDRIRLLSLSANLGDSRSIVTHPASTTHSGLSEEQRALAGITDGMVRVSVGLEHVDDIWADLEQALGE